MFRSQFRWRIELVELFYGAIHATLNIVFNSKKIQPPANASLGGRIHLLGITVFNLHK